MYYLLSFSMIQNGYVLFTFFYDDIEWICFIYYALGIVFRNIDVHGHQNNHYVNRLIHLLVC